MKSSSILVRSLQLFALLAFNGIKLTASAPTSLEESFSGVDQRENEISSDKTELEKHFREAYVQRMKSFMNASMDPCVDFYEYACGNFSDALEDNESEQKRSNLLDIQYTLLGHVDHILTKQREPNESYFKEMQIAKKFFDTCINAKLYPVEPSTEYLNILKKIGGFPAVDPSWNASNFDWFNMTAHLSRYGVDGLVKENIFLKHPFPPFYAIAKFGFDFDIYLENIETKESPGFVYIEEVMRRILGIYGVNGSKADQVIEDIVVFWKKALEAEKEYSDNGDCKLEFIDSEFEKGGLFDSFSDRWMGFFEIAWNTSEFQYTDTSSCPCSIYFQKLNTIIAEKPDAAANYMALKFLYDLHPNLKSGKFQRTYCLKLIKRSMPHLLSHFYLKEHYKKENELDIYFIIYGLSRSLVNLMGASDWLDEPTRAEALKKAQTLKIRVGQVLDPITATMIEQTQLLNPTGNFPADILELAKFIVDISHYPYMHQDIPENTAPLEVLDAVQVNAFHYAIDNSINVLAGILSPPVYHPHMSLAMKYGALGYILGHELTHGFDSSGSYFDADLKFGNWWSLNSTLAFEERSNCFAQHYSKFKVPELNRKLNGSTSLDENIADSGGLREAFSAFRNFSTEESKKNKADFERNEKLPGLDLSPEQTFFLSFAQLYCSKYTPKHYLKELGDNHPMDKYRVTGSLQNFEEFALTYDCPLGSPMNPNEKCRVW